MSSSPNNSQNTLNINSVNTTNNINEVEKPIKKHNNQYTKMKEQEQESQGIEDFELPKSVVTRLSKEAVPDNIKFQKDSLLAIVKSSSVFINYLSSAAQEKAHDKGNKTITANHVINAVKDIEIGKHNNELENLLKNELNAYKKLQQSKKDTKKTTTNNNKQPTQNPSGDHPERTNEQNNQDLVDDNENDQDQENDENDPQENEEDFDQSVIE